MFLRRPGAEFDAAYAFFSCNPDCMEEQVPEYGGGISCRLQIGNIVKSKTITLAPQQDD